jgi:hypothetical protein
LRLVHFDFLGSACESKREDVSSLDVREQGSFQHDVLALFHRALMKEGNAGAI